MTTEVPNPARVCVWSGPRNLSTALMYAFAQRADTRVVDEPLYAHYLEQTDASKYHPATAEVLASQCRDGNRVVQEVILGPTDRPVLFLKQMTHHLVPPLDRRFFAHTRNVILTRDPQAMLPSFAVQVQRPTLADTGYPQSVALLEELLALGQDPPVLDAGELLKNPAGVLGTLCGRLGLPFDEAMLRWSRGPRPEDGVWARHWYGSVHRSTGFTPYRPPPSWSREQHHALGALLGDCQPLYQKLWQRALRA